MPTDRELLLNAAQDAHAGQELRDYAKKFKALQALERKLLRQQEALEAAESATEAEEDSPASVGSADSFSPEGGEAKGKNVERLRAAIGKTEIAPCFRRRFMVK